MIERPSGRFQCGVGGERQRGADGARRAEVQGLPLAATLTTGLGVFCDGYDLSSPGAGAPLVLALLRPGQPDRRPDRRCSPRRPWSAPPRRAAVRRSRPGGPQALLRRRRADPRDRRYRPGFRAERGLADRLRFVLGVGVGADYVLSPVIMAEHANRADRGRALGLGFGTMWPIGALAAVLLKFLLAALHVPDDLQWRLVLAGGAIPALGVLYFRRRMPETARFLAQMAGEQAEAARVIDADQRRCTLRRPSRTPAASGRCSPATARPIFAAALLWMLYDLVVYVFILFGPNIIAKSLGMDAGYVRLPHRHPVVLPASFVGSLFVIDRFGRKPLQGWGFLGGAALLGVFALMQHQLLAMPALAFGVYGLLNICHDRAWAGLRRRHPRRRARAHPRAQRRPEHHRRWRAHRRGDQRLCLPAAVPPDRPRRRRPVRSLHRDRRALGRRRARHLALVPETGRISLEALNREHEPAPAAAAG